MGGVCAVLGKTTVTKGIVVTSGGLYVACLQYFFPSVGDVDDVTCCSVMQCDMNVMQSDTDAY